LRKPTLTLNVFKCSENSATDHSIRCLTIRISTGDKGLGYSRDGRPTPSTRRLYHKSGLLVQEAYTEKNRIPGHANLSEVLSVARTANVSKLSPAHMRRDFEGVMASIVPELGAVDFQLLMENVFEQVAV